VSLVERSRGSRGSYAEFSRLERHREKVTASVVVLQA